MPFIYASQKTLGKKRFLCVNNEDAISSSKPSMYFFLNDCGSGNELPM